MRPSIWLGLLAICSGIVWALAGTDWGLLLAGLTLLGALLDAMSLPRPSDVRVRRVLPPRMRQGRAITVVLQVQNLRAQSVAILLRDEPPEAAEAPLPMRAEVGPGAQVEVSYRMVPEERGRQSFGRAFWLAFGSLRLLVRYVAVPLPQEVLVYPDLLGNRPRLATGQVGRGERFSRPGQFGQFDSLREYAPGDPYRSVNWLATARRGNLLVNAYRTESEQPVILLVDGGRSLFGRDASGDRMALTIRAAYALADEAVAYGDRVGLLVYDSERRQAIAPTGGVRALHRVARAFALTDARPVESDHLGALAWALEVRARRSLVVWFTDLGEAALQEELLPFLRAMSRQHLLLQVAIPGRDIAVRADDDAYAAAASVIVRREQRMRAAALTAAGVSIVRGTSGDALGEAVRRAYRAIKEGGRL